MNYEELYTELNERDKDLSDRVRTAGRLGKAVGKHTESGDLAKLREAARQLEEAAGEILRQAEAIRAGVEGFDARAYFADGDFTRQLLDACREAGVDVQGEKGVYEMFPYKVRIVGDGEHPEEVWLDRKKIPTVRPLTVANTIREGLDRLYQARFNAQAFLGEMAEAYDTVCLKDRKKGQRVGTTQDLDKVYKAMTPMSRARKEYTAKAFAFDLARLYELGSAAWVTKDGRLFDFGTSRDNGKGIRVLSSTGVESYVATIRSLNPDTEES